MRRSTPGPRPDANRHSFTAAAKAATPARAKAATPAAAAHPTRAAASGDQHRVSGAGRNAVQALRGPHAESLGVSLKGDAKAEDEVEEQDDEPIDLTRYTEAGSVFHALETIVEGHHPVKLLRASWLIQQKGCVLRRRQELPPDAFISVEELRVIWEESGQGGRDAVLPVAAVSFCWDSRAHPDPLGKQLSLMIKTLEQELPKYQRANKTFKGFSDVGVFWDWASLLQKAEQDTDRTKDEAAAFSHALHRTMDLWYAHQGTTVFLLTEHPGKRGSEREIGYDQSGWTTYERCSAEQIKRAYRYQAEWSAVMDLGVQDEKAIAAGRRWPIGPADFDVLISSRTFTNGADRDAVRMLFRRMSRHQLGGIERFDFGGSESTGPIMAEPSEADASQLGGCLALCRNLDKLDLRRTGLTGKAVRAMCARLPSNALPSLSRLVLSHNSITDNGVTALCAAAGKDGFGALQILLLNYNKLTDKSASALSRAKASGLFPNLESIGISDNRLTGAGEKSLQDVGLM